MMKNEKSEGMLKRNIKAKQKDYNCPSFPITGFLSAPPRGDLEREVLNWMRDRSSGIQIDRIFLLFNMKPLINT